MTGGSQRKFYTSEELKQKDCTNPVTDYLSGILPYKQSGTASLRSLLFISRCFTIAAKELSDMTKSREFDDGKACTKQIESSIQRSPSCSVP